MLGVTDGIRLGAIVGTVTAIGDGVGPFIVGPSVGASIFIGDREIGIITVIGVVVDIVGANGLPVGTVTMIGDGEVGTVTRMGGLIGGVTGDVD